MTGRIQGTVVLVRESGDLVTDISRDRLRGVSNHHRLSVVCEGHVTNDIFDSTHCEPDLTLLARWGSDDLLELTLVGENASQFLGIRCGAIVKVEW